MKILGTQRLDRLDDAIDFAVSIATVFSKLLELQTTLPDHNVDQKNLHLVQNLLDMMTTSDNLSSEQLYHASKGIPDLISAFVAARVKFLETLLNTAEPIHVAGVLAHAVKVTCR